MRIWVVGKGAKNEFTGASSNGFWQEVCFPEVKTGQQAENVPVNLNTLGGKGPVCFDEVELDMKQVTAT